MSDVAWTKDEYTPAVGRLHDRVLDLEDENKRLREALKHIERLSLHAAPSHFKAIARAALDPPPVVEDDPA